MDHPNLAQPTASLDEPRSANGHTAPDGQLARAAELLRGSDARPGAAQHPWHRGYLLRRLLFASDVLALLGSYGVFLIAESATGKTGSVLNLVEFLALMPLWIWLASLAGLYHLSERRVDHSFVDEVGPVTMVTTMWSWCSLILGAALASGETPLFGPIVVWATAVPIVLVARGIARMIARRSSWFRQPALLVGDSDDVERVLRRLLRHPELGIDPAACLRKRGAGFALERLTADGRMEVGPQGANWNLDASDVKELVTRAGIGRVIVTGWSEGLSERTELIRVLAESGVCVDYVSGEPEALCSTAVLHHVEGLPILTIRLAKPRMTLWLKRAVDLVVAALGLVTFAPLLAYVAVRIKLQSPGPVLFRQLRTGIGGVPFELLKLRTMVDGADDMRPELWDRLNGEGNGNGAKMIKLSDDPRVTRFGGWLRRWSIDELPQLWNVIRGDMSLVGPRPLPLDESRFAEAHFADRVRMRPGITGPWQIHGRSDIPFDDMVKLDYLYVASWTMREDMRLLARTVGVVLRGRGAY